MTSGEVMRTNWEIAGHLRGDRVDIVRDGTKWFLRWIRRVALGLLIALVMIASVTDWRADLSDFRSYLTFAAAKSLSDNAAYEHVITKPVRVAAVPEVSLESGSVVVPGAPSNATSRDVRKRSGTTTKLSVDEVVLNKPRIVIRIPGGQAQPKNGLALPELIGPLSAALTNVDFKRLKIVDGNLELQQQGHRPKRVTKLSANVLFLEGRAARITGSFSYKNRPQMFTVVLGKSREDSNVLKFPIRTKLEGKNAIISFDGTMNFAGGLNAEGSLQMLMPDIADTFAWLGHDGLKVPPKTVFRADGPITWRNEILSFQEASFAFGKNSALGSLAISFARSVPSIEGTLDFERLDVTELLPRNGKERPLRPVGSLLESILPQRNDAQRVKQHEALGSAAPSTIQLYAFPLLHNFATDLRISAEDFVAGEWRSKRTAMTVTVKSGKLFADVAEMVFENGTARGQLEVEAPLFRNPLFRIRGVVDGVDIAPLFEDGESPVSVSGRSRLSVDLVSRGANRDEVLSGLSGTAELTMTEGGTTNLNIPGILFALQDKGSGAARGKALKRSTFNELNAKLSIKDGLVRCERLQLRSGDGKIEGGGEIHLSKRHIMLKMRLGRIGAPVQSARPKVSQVPSATIERGVTISGSLASPSLFVTGN